MDWATTCVFRDEAMASAKSILENLEMLGVAVEGRLPDTVSKLVESSRVIQVNAGMIRNEGARKLGRKVQELVEEVAARGVPVSPPTLDRVKKSVDLVLELLEKMSEAIPSPADERVDSFVSQYRAAATAPPAATPPAVEGMPSPAEGTPPGAEAPSTEEIPVRLDANLVDAYVEESQELLGQLELQLMTLEQQPEDHELINGIFRIAHSMKGNSFTVGMRKTGELAHKMENVFERARSGKLAVTPRVTDGMLACLDGLRMNLANLAQGRHVERDLSHLALRLEGVTAGSPRRAMGEGMVAAPFMGASSDAGVKPAPTPSPSKGEGQGLPADSVAGGGERLRDAHGTPAPAAAGMRSLRVDVQKLDRVMNLMGEIVINKSRLDRQVSVALRLLERMGWANAVVEKIASSVSMDRERMASDVLPRLPESNGQAAPVVNGPDREGVHHGALGSRSQAQARRLMAELRRLLESDDPGELAPGELRDDIGRTNEVLGRVIGELQEGLMGLRMVPIQTVFGKFPRLVRDLSRSMQKEVVIEIRGEETELDKNIVEEISDPLLHLVRNAIDHGIESAAERERSGKPAIGTIRLNAFHEGDHIIIEVEDDGRGLEPTKLGEVAVRKGLLTREQADHLDRFAALNLIFLPGFSSKEEVTAVSGRGVGMDVVKFNIAKLNGTIDIDTEPGEGTCFTLKLPLTMAIINALLVGVAEQTYALPLSSVEEAIGITEQNVKGVGKREVIHLRDRVLPVVRLESVLALPSGPAPSNGRQRPVIVAGSAESRIGLIVDRIRGKQEIVIKSLGDVLLKVKHLSGGTILGDGRVVPILNIQSIIDAASQGAAIGGPGIERTGAPPTPAVTAGRARVLVVDDSAVLRKMYEKLFERAQVQLFMAEDGLDGWEKVQSERFDLIVTDIMMPRMDGIEFARHVRSLPGYREVPILVVSSRKQDQDVAAGFEAGVNEYIFKPLEGNRLLSTVRRYLQA
ncbi:MAG: hybrid sensor histidine kinase/response regulator [Nitrospirae bacterium]|nr:hybrid sensor histidine kinase/response regulator [Nitrospirota bacterium]